MRSTLPPPAGEDGSINATELAGWLASADPTAQPLLVDVREDEEWQDGHLPQAVHLPLGQLEAQIRAQHPLMQADPIVVYCRAGVRSRAAIELMQRLHHPGRLLNLTGGILAWQQAGLALDEAGADG